jgi:hypothetical protein
MSAYVSFICKLPLLRLYMWHHYNVFINGPFFSKCRISFISVVGPYVCCVSRMCCEYFEFGLFDRIACICSLYLILKFLPTCPMYLCWKPLHFIWYMPLVIFIKFIGRTVPRNNYLRCLFIFISPLHVILLYLLYLPVSCFLSWRWLCIVFFVLYGILMFVFLNNMMW